MKSYNVIAPFGHEKIALTRALQPVDEFVKKKKKITMTMTRIKA